MNAGQHDLPVSCLRQAKHFSLYILQGPGTNRAADGRYNAIGTMVAAAFLDFQDSTGMFILGM